jgi:hypothetical protein
MPQKPIPVSDPDPGERLNRKFGNLAGAGKRVIKVLYPSWLAQKLGIAREGMSGDTAGAPPLRAMIPTTS